MEDSESDDDLFLDDEPPAKKAPNRKAVTAKAKMESDDEMDNLFLDDAPTQLVSVIRTLIIAILSYTHTQLVSAIRMLRK